MEIIKAGRKKECERVKAIVLLHGKKRHYPCKLIQLLYILYCIFQTNQVKCAELDSDKAKVNELTKPIAMATQQPPHHHHMHIMEGGRGW